MQSRRKILVIVASVVIGLLFVGAVAILVRGFIQFSEVESSLKESRERLGSLYGRNPFPSQENLKKEKENLAAVEQELADLQLAMAEGQMEPVGQSPALFINQFFETQKDLLAQARAASITLPKNFDFSFGRHMTGILPASQDVPRLTQQLKIVDALCRIFYKAKVSSLTGIARQEFEVDAPGAAATAKVTASGRRSAEVELKNITDATAGVIPPGQLYGRWHFVFQLTGREPAIMNALNGLAKSPVFAVVTRLNIEGEEKLFERKEVAVVKTGEESLTVKEPPKAKDYRVVCGRDAVLNARIEVDVYQFARPQAAAEPVKKPGGAK